MVNSIGPGAETSAGSAVLVTCSEGLSRLTVAEPSSVASVPSSSVATIVTVLVSSASTNSVKVQLRVAP